RERAVGGGRHAVPVAADPAGLGDLGGDLRHGEHAAVAGLGALAELDLDHLDLGIDRLGGEAVRIEAAFGRAATEIAGGHLPDDVAAVHPVVPADRAFAGVVGEAAQVSALVEGHDGVGAQRAEAGA